MPIVPLRPSPVMTLKWVPYLSFNGDGYVNIIAGALPTPAITVLLRMRRHPSLPTYWEKALNTGPTTNNGIRASVGGLDTDKFNLALSWDSGAVQLGVWNLPVMSGAFLAVGTDGTRVWAGGNGAFTDVGAAGTTPDWADRSLVIGANYSYSEKLKGVVYGVWIYSRLLSAQEVTDAYEGHPPRNGLVGEWLLNEGVGNVAHDTSGNGNHLPIIGGTWVVDENRRAAPLAPVRALTPAR